MHTLDATTLLATPDGPCPAGRLAPGSRVTGPDGTLRRVQWVQPLTVAAEETLDLPADSLAPGLPAIALRVGRATLVGLPPDWTAVPAADLLDGLRVTRGTAAEAMVSVELDMPGAMLAAGLALGGTAAEPLAAVEALAALARQRGETPGPLQGNLDRVTHDFVSGWAHDRTQPSRPVGLILIVNGIPRNATLARDHRADLAEARIGDGHAALRFILDPPLPADRPHLIQVRRATDRMPVPGSPVLLEQQTQAAAPVGAYAAMVPEERARLIGLLQAHIDALAGG